MSPTNRLIRDVTWLTQASVIYHVVASGLHGQGAIQLCYILTRPLQSSHLRNPIDALGSHLMVTTLAWQRAGHTTSP